MADELGDQQEHIEYLELRRVWKSIGLTLTNDVLQEWRTKYPVNIAVLDSGVKEDHQAFQSRLHPACKVKLPNSNSFVAAGNDTADGFGHGTFCAGVAAGYPIPAPEKVKDYKIQDCAERFCKWRKLCDGKRKGIEHIFKGLSGLEGQGTSDANNQIKEWAEGFCNLWESSDRSRKELEEIFEDLSGGGAENLPFGGVAPFANIISYKVIDDENKLNEEALSCALRDIVEHNSRVEFEEKIHIVSMSLSAHYHDGVRRALYDVLNDDMIVVAAACNMGQKNHYCSGNILFPARFGNVISVGSHDNHGQPSKMSSVGREVDFLAPGEEIWGPSIFEETEEPSTSAEKEYSSFIQKDKGTSMSAAIVSGIVALVLAFVHKEKGAEARAEIANNPVMKKILGNMATKSGEHDEVFGYGSLKPLKVFGYGAYILWSLIESLPSITPSGADANHDINTKVSKFILKETSAPMYSRENIDEIQAIETPCRDSHLDYIYPYNYHEDKDDREVKPCPFECLMESTLDALDYLKIRKLTSHVKVIHLELPYLPSLSEMQRNVYIMYRHRKLLLCDNVLPLIIESKVQVIERLVFPEMDYIYMSDLCRFIKRLSESLLSGLKSIVLPFKIPFGVLCRIAHILDGCSVTVYVRQIRAKRRDEMTQECQFPNITTVKVICSDHEPGIKDYIERVGFKIPFDVTWVNYCLVSLQSKPEGDDEPGTNDNGPGTINDDESGTNDDEPGTNDDEPGTNDDESGTNDDESGTNDDESGTNDDEPGTNDDEPGTNDDESSTNDDEPCECLDDELTHDDNSEANMYYSMWNNLELPNDLELPKVTVAILGDAVDIHHKEIKNKIIPDRNFKCFTVPSGGTCEKDRYLGTLSATIIAGESEGVCPFVDLVYATVVNAEARTKPEWVVSALEWIEREHSNVHIVVIPLGFDKFHLGLFKIINRLSKNMIIVCAASNSRKPLMLEICYPAIYGDVICVGSRCNTCQPSSFSPQGREIDLLVLGKRVGFCFSVRERLVPAAPILHNISTHFPINEIISTTYSLSGTCIAAAYAAGVIAQIVAFALRCGFERQQITNNTVMRELLKHLTCNFSHDPRSGHGWLNLPRSELLNNPDYFKKVVNEILSIDD